MKTAARLPRAVTENLVIREVDDETLVYDMEREHAHCLNQTAALVWQLCDGKTSVKQAARSLQSKLGTNVDSDLVWLAIKQLEQFHLVERAAQTPSISRRTLVLKYAPAILALPVIMSITAPTAAQAGSCKPAGAGCESSAECCSKLCIGFCKG